MKNLVWLAKIVSTLLLVGCASPYTPKVDRPFEEIPEFTSSARVALVNAQTDEESHRCGRVLANYKEWTDVALQIAERELTKRGVTVDPSAERALRLAIIGTKHKVGFVTIRTDIEMRAETGDGYSARYTGANSSTMVANIPRQIDGAMMRVVVELLKDPRIVDYLGQ